MMKRIQFRIGPHRFARGFTLMEILATLALVAIVMPSIMQGFSLSMDAAGKARHQAQAASLAHGKMAELVSAAIWDRPILAGDCGQEWPEYRWEATLDDFDSGLQLEELDVTVFWKQFGGERSITVTTLVYTGGTTTGGILP